VRCQCCVSLSPLPASTCVIRRYAGN